MIFSSVLAEFSPYLASIIIELIPKLFFRIPIKERRFYYVARIKIKRKEAWEHLEQFYPAFESAKLIRQCFPELLSLLKRIPDPRHQSYITYPGVVLLMTRILSSLFYINSMHDLYRNSLGKAVVRKRVKNKKKKSRT